MLKHILFLRPISQEDLEKIISSSPYRFGAEFIDGKINFGRLEINYIFDSENIAIGLQCEAPRQFDIDNFYSIVEYIGNIQKSIHGLPRI